jgi:hypothetical protein
MLELTPETQVATIIFVGGQFEDGQGVDWLGYVCKQPGEPWRFEYRFRYHVDDKAFDSEDRKSWYAFTARDPQEGPRKLIEAAMMIAAMTAKRYAGEMHVLDVNGNGDDAQRMLAEVPWIEMRTEEDPGDGSTEATARARASGGKHGN